MKLFKIIMVVGLFAAFLYACSGGGGSETPPPVVSNPPSDDGGSVGGSDPKDDMGALPPATQDSDDEQKSILNIQGIQIAGVSSDLEELKVCTDSACWTVLEAARSNGQSKSSFAGKKVSKVTANTSVVDIGSFDLSAVDGDISSFQYRYKGQQDEIGLSSPVKPGEATDKNVNVYIELAESLSVPFSSLSFDDGRNGIFLPYEEFEKEFVNGVTVQVPQGSIDQMAHIYIASIGKTIDEYVEMNSYVLDFYSVDVASDISLPVENEFPSEFENNIRVLVPIIVRSGDINFIEQNYILSVNSRNIDYDIIQRNSQYFISFYSIQSSINVTLFNKENYSVRR